MNKVTITTMSGREVSGLPNVFINEYKNQAEVYLDDMLVAAYSDCNDPDEAIDMMLEDYGVPAEEYSP